MSKKSVEQVKHMSEDDETELSNDSEQEEKATVQVIDQEKKYEAVYGQFSCDDGD